MSFVRNIKCYMIVSLLLLLFSLSIASAQQVDPFYINILTKGKKYYMDSNYRMVIKELKIAVFGLHGNNTLLAEAHVFLGLSHYYLKEMDSFKEHLDQARSLIGQEELYNMDLDESILIDLERIIYVTQTQSTTDGGYKFLPKLPEENLVQNQEKIQSQLEQEIKNNRQIVSLYYSLYKLHRENYNFKEAKKTVEDFVKYNPSEAYGYYLLGIIQYQDKQLKESQVSIENFFELSDGMSIKHEIFTEARAYHILSLYLQGKRDEAANTVAASRDFLTRDNIRLLYLSEKDKAILLQLLQN